MYTCTCVYMNIDMCGYSRVLKGIKAFRAFLCAFRPMLATIILQMQILYEVFYLFLPCFYFFLLRNPKISTIMRRARICFELDALPTNFWLFYTDFARFLCVLLYAGAY